MYWFGKALTLKTSTSENCQTHLNNSLATAAVLFECVWQFCGVCGKKVKNFQILFESIISKLGYRCLQRHVDPRLVDWNQGLRFNARYD